MGLTKYGAPEEPQGQKTASADPEALKQTLASEDEQDENDGD